MKFIEKFKQNTIKKAVEPVVSGALVAAYGVLDDLCKSKGIDNPYDLGSFAETCLQKLKENSGGETK